MSLDDNVELRLEKALFYKTVLGTLQVEPGSDPVQQEVLTELQDFVRNRMKVLMGMAPDPNRQPLAPEPEQEEPASVPRSNVPAPAKTLPKRPPADPNALPMGLKATGQTLNVPLELRSAGGQTVTRDRIFREVIAPDGSKGWIGADNQLYMIKTEPQTGVTFMQNVTQQAQSSSHRRAPKVYGDQAVHLAISQASQLDRGKSINKLIIENADRHYEVNGLT